MSTVGITARGVVIAVSAQRIVVEKDTEGRVYLDRSQWCSDRPPRRNLRVEINERLEARIEPLRPAFSVAELTRSL